MRVKIHPRGYNLLPEILAVISITGFELDLTSYKHVSPSCNGSLIRKFDKHISNIKQGQMRLLRTGCIWISTNFEFSWKIFFNGSWFFLLFLWLHHVLLH